MLAENFDTLPVQRLLTKHSQHQTPYDQDFKGLNLVIFPEVFNPAYTQVSGLLADNLTVSSGASVLEMFSGSGALSFLAAQNASSVVGVDLSPHAINCAQHNAKRLGLEKKIKFRLANLWQGVTSDEKFDLIVANPPLLPAVPENWLELAVADSPEMTTAKNFIQGCPKVLTEDGQVLMAFSNACKAYYDDPLAFIDRTAQNAGMEMNIRAEKDVGYEVYRILEFRKK